MEVVVMCPDRAGAAARQEPPSFGRSRWGRVASALAVVGVVLVALVFVVPYGARLVLYLFGFLALFLAAYAAVVGRVLFRGERFTVRPRTRLGWLSLVLVLLGWAMIYFPSTTVVTTAEESQLLNSVILLGFCAMFLAGVVVVVALLRSGERSLPVIVLGLLGGLVVPFFFLGQLAAAH